MHAWAAIIQIPLNLKKISKNTLLENFGVSKVYIPNVTLFILFIASLCLGIWGINIYRMTIIPFTYLAFLIVVGGALAFFVINFALRPTYHFIWKFLVSIVIGGGILSFLLLYFNSTFARNELMTENFIIIKSGNLAKPGRSNCGRPYSVINFHGVVKELVFFCDYEKTITNFKNVTLVYSNGLFGFNVIRSKSLL
jgi:hypothetical protein